MTANNNTCYSKQGQSEKPLSFYGIGFNSGREHQVTEKGEVTKAYATWSHMLTRCYCAKTHKKQPTYIGCEVDERWHDFQDFADWFYSHPYSGFGYQLDKDLLHPTNKIYSPETCCFVPKELNCLLLSSPASRGEYPQGVTLNKKTGRYISRLWMNKKSRSLGYFNCPEEAHQAYKKTKEAYVKEKALEWQDRIADDVFQALMNWTLDS